MKKEDLLKIFPELKDEQYAEIQRLNGLDVNPIKQDLEHYKEQLADANKTIKSYKDMDIEAIKTSEEEWERKFDDAERQHTEPGVLINGNFYTMKNIINQERNATDYAYREIQNVYNYMSREILPYLHTLKGEKL